MEETKDNKRVRVEVIEEDTDSKETESPEEEVKKDNVVDETKEELPETSNEDNDIEDDEKTVESAEEDPPEPKEKPPFWILFFAFLIGLILGAGLIGGIFYYRTNVENAEIDEESTSDTEVVVVETSTPEPTTLEETVDLTEYKINILNGSGIKGEAGKVDALLQKAGFNEADTGNSDSYDYEETEVSYKESVPKDVIEDLIESIGVYETKEVDNLKETSDYDILITVGVLKS